MTENNPETSNSGFLEGGEATQWFYGQPGGGYILDHHLAAIQAVFGSDVPYRIRADLDPSTNEPNILMIDILLPVNDQTAWDQVIAVQELLVNEEPEMRARSRVKLPFNRIVVSLSGAPSNWSNLVEEIE